MTSHKRVALVTGASRGIGKAIALELGLAGFSVYLTGQTRRGAESYSKLSGSIDETADQIITSGGDAIETTQPLQRSSNRSLTRQASLICSSTTPGLATAPCSVSSRKL